MKTRMISSVAENNDSACGCQGATLVPYLVSSRALHRLFSRICRTRTADWVIGSLARSVLKKIHSGKVDYEKVASVQAFESLEREALYRRDIDTQFFAGIAGNQNGRKKIVQILQNLENLDFDVRVGLLKTWIHASVVTATSRDAHYFRQVRDRLPDFRPMDAIVAPFGGCNLRCRGCFYLSDLNGCSTSPDRLDTIISQLRAMDVYHVLLAGKGEPFFDERSRRALFAVARKAPQMFFTVYTNGTNISEKDLDELKAHPNILPVISIDGPPGINDWRRGIGVYDRIMNLMDRMRSRGMFFGYICTVFNQNLDALTEPDFAVRMAKMGCQVGYYSLFVTPPGGENADMMLDAERRTRYFEDISRLNGLVSIPLVDIDGIEAGFGCRARKGATIYVDAITGGVSPCIRATLASPSCNVFQPGESGKLKKILDTNDFIAFRSALPESGPCIAFQNSDENCTCSG